MKLAVVNKNENLPRVRLKPKEVLRKARSKPAINPK